VLCNKLQPEVMDLLLMADTDDAQQVATWSAWARNTAVLERRNGMEQILLASRLTEATRSRTARRRAQHSARRTSSAYKQLRVRKHP